METKKDIKLKPKPCRFCEEYIIDLNATRAATSAGYSAKTARAIGSKLLTKADIKKKIKELQATLDKVTGITRIRVINALSAIAFSSVQAYPRTVRKDIGTKEVPNIVELIPVTIRTNDKLTALAKLIEMHGYNEPIKIDFSIDKLTDAQVDELFERVINQISN